MRSQQADRGRNSQVIRVIEVMREVMTGSPDIYALAERHRVHPRTILRDIAAIREAGLEVKSEATPDSRRRKLHADVKGQVRDFAKLVDKTHYLSLTVALAQTGALRTNEGVYHQLEDLAEKVERAMSPGDRALLEAINQAFYTWEKFAWRITPPDVLWPLIDAIARRHECRVEYAAAGGGRRKKSYIVLPLRLFAHDGAAYLLCHVPKHDRVITLNLHRLTRLVDTGVVGTWPEGFNAEAHEVAVFGVTRDGPVEHWRLRFDPAVASYVRERTWHATQTLEELPDGGVELRFHCEGGVEVRRWIASWRDLVEVLEPVAVRAEFAALGRGLVARYDRPRSPHA